MNEIWQKIQHSQEQNIIEFKNKYSDQRVMILSIQEQNMVSSIFCALRDFQWISKFSTLKDGYQCHDSPGFKEGVVIIKNTVS